MGHVQHQLDIYPVHLHLITKPKQWRKHHAVIPMHQPEAPESAGLTATTLDRHSGWLHVTIWVDAKWHGKHGTEKTLTSTAVHEAVHAAGSILDHFGQKYDGQSEALAHLVDWLTDWLCSALLK